MYKRNAIKTFCIVILKQSITTLYNLIKWFLKLLAQISNISAEDIHKVPEYIN